MQNRFWGPKLKFVYVTIVCTQNKTFYIKSGWKNGKLSTITKSKYEFERLAEQCEHFYYLLLNNNTEFKL